MPAIVGALPLVDMARFDTGRAECDSKANVTLLVDEAMLTGVNLLVYTQPMLVG